MYECPNCAANLKFSISKQQLYCDHCDTCVDPYSFSKDRDAEESQYYEARIFTCPQCGGQLISEDTTAATFCSYCGASTILDSRISQERRPTYIIPFSQTINRCKNAYKKMMQKAFFAPDELKDEEHIEKFRGIYMPYWVYSFEKKGPAVFKGKKSHRRGDYIITKHYDINTDLDVEYQGLAFDASATFSDSLSSAIAPFDIKKGKHFTPSFLSGFYADTSDVDSYLYRDDAKEMVMDDITKKLQRKSPFSKYNVTAETNRYSLRNTISPKSTATELALFPVWFLSYRKDDRVAYAVVNGQTGKVAADLPVDIRKYLLGSLILALPLFILLNLFFTIKPTTLLLICGIIATVFTFIVNRQATRILRKDRNEDDKGMTSLREKQLAKQNKGTLLSEQSPEYGAALDKAEQNDATLDKVALNGSGGFLSRIIDSIGNVLSQISEALGNIPRGIRIFLIVMISYMLFFFLTFVGIFLGIGSEFFSSLIVLFPFAITAFCIYFIVKASKKPGEKAHKFSKEDFTYKLPIIAKPLTALFVAILIGIINPVSDLYYYGASILCMGMLCWAFTDIIRSHNLLTTRKLPQLNKRGGDENA